MALRTSLAIQVVLKAIDDRAVGKVLEAGFSAVPL